MNSMTQWPLAKYWTKCWNPIVGCVECSPACANCYAREMLKNRFGQPFKPHPSKSQRPPLSGVVFCGNMTDLFGEWRTCCEMAADIRTAIERGGGATYLWLTKRPSRMVYAIDYMRVAVPPMHYFGFTTESQEWYDARCLDMALTGVMLDVNYWLSAEPLLGPIDLLKGRNGMPPFRWVVVGCESGPRRRPCKIEWVEGIVGQCLAAGVPGSRVYLKRWISSAL